MSLIYGTRYTMYKNKKFQDGRKEGIYFNERTNKFIVVGKSSVQNNNKYSVKFTPLKQFDNIEIAEIFYTKYLESQK